ncbi:MAG: SCO2524 family protein [Pseudonocardiaceae bacterium]
MKIQPRQQLLEIWRATVRASFQDGKWVCGGRDQSNSISDAEQLLCLLYPATELPSFRLDNPNETADDILDALQDLGGATEIPLQLIRVLVEYMEQNRDSAGLPTFSAEGYFDPHEPGAVPSARQLELDIVDSFATSIQLTLAVLSFTRIFRRSVRRQEFLEELDKLDGLAATRLTAAMVGLLRSFSINVFDIREPAGRILIRRSNKGNLPERQVIRDLQVALEEVRVGLRYLTIGSGQDADLDSPGRLFECGWSWGIVKGAQLVVTQEEIAQPDGVAMNKPWLYFTVTTLACLEVLFSERVRISRLLNDEQRELAQSLQNRSDLTQRYWSTIATFGVGRWPLEDLPWCTSDGQESDHFSLLVSAVVVQDLVRKRASDAELDRVGRVLEELAERERINRRPLQDDSALEVHAPGVRLRLLGMETVGDHPVGWLVTSFSPLLLKRILAIAGLVGDTDVRGRLLTLADNVWDHLLLRRITDGIGRDLWDQPNGAYPQLDTRYDLPSWYYTERVAECLVTAAAVVSRAPVLSPMLTELTRKLLHEADHLFDRELLIGSGEAGPSMRAVLQGIRGNLRRAWDILGDRPGSAMVLANEVLRDLERLASARQDVAEGT